MAGLFVKKGDTVLVISGKNKGVKGTVLIADPGSNRVLVEGVGRITKHTKVTQSVRGSNQGGIVHQEAPVHVSNVQVICPKCDKPSRIGHRRDEPGADGKARSIRICKRCNGDI